MVALILKGESEQIEFKSSFDREAIETLAAFANTTGGNLLVGVQDNGVVSGVTVGIGTIQNWINQIEMATTLAIIPDAALSATNGKKDAHFCIAAFPVKPAACRRKYFIRANASNQIMPLNEVAEAYL
jgi:ATP-dependent DNA helicase RecG